jgi:hypothetical protein
MEEAGLEASGTVATDTDPVIATLEAFDIGRHDEVVVSTLPESLSHWLSCDGPARIRRATGANVHHVVAAEPRPVPRTVHVERKRPGHGLLTPLVPLGYGSSRLS